MISSLFLAKVLGIYLLLAALLLVLKRKSISLALDEFSRNTLLLRFVGALETLFALIILTGHFVWEGWSVVITVIGVLSLIEGMFYLFAERKAAHKVVSRFISLPWLIGTSIIMFVFGVFLVVLGFSL